MEETGAACADAGRRGRDQFVQDSPLEGAGFEPWVSLGEERSTKARGKIGNNSLRAPTAACRELGPTPSSTARQIGNTAEPDRWMICAEEALADCNSRNRSGILGADEHLRREKR